MSLHIRNLSLISAGAIIVIIGTFYFWRYLNTSRATVYLTAAAYESINTAEELTRWRDAPPHIRKNRYAPEAIREAMTPQEIQERAIRFSTFFKARKAVLQGTANRATSIAYYSGLIEDLQQRIDILTILEPEKMLTSSSRQTIVRGATNRDELARLKAAILMNRAIMEILSANREQQPMPIKKPVRERVICLVDNTGIVYCVLEDRIVNLYLSGYWKGTIWETLFFNEARAYDIVRRIDEIAMQHDLDVRDNTFIRCANGAWWSANTNGPKVGLPNGITPIDLPSIMEMEQMAGSCRDLSFGTSRQQGGSSVGPLGQTVGISQMAKNTIARIDAKVNNCTEVDNRITIGGGVGKGLLDLILPGWLDLFGWVNSSPHPDTGPDFKAEAKERERERLAEETRENDRAIDLLNEAADNLEKAADELEKQADEQADAEKEKQAEEKRKQAAAFRREAECRSKISMSCAEIEAKKEKAEKPTPTGGQGQQPSNQLDGVNYSTCASLKASWEWFKAECDRTGGWDRPGSECNEMIRRENGCVSTTLINPTPEGDRTCIRITISEAEIWSKRCEERKKIMSVAEIMQSSCPSIDRLVFDTRLTDPCNDPAVRPTPETTCTKPGQTQFPGAPPTDGKNPLPMPYGDFVATNGGIVFDALWFEGLGTGDSHKSSKR